MSPDARECTLVTNGDNESTGYINRQKVFSSTGMNLNMPAPFEYYIETQTNLMPPPSPGCSRAPLPVTMPYKLVDQGDKRPANSVVRVVSATSGDTLASAGADYTGAAFLDVGRCHMPIDTGVMVFDSSDGNLLASSAAHASIYGGDVFTVGSPGSEATTITVN